MNNKRKWLALVNPSSAGGRSKERWNFLQDYLSQLQIKYDVFETKYEKHGIELVKENLKDYDGVITVGGDGTVNEAINGLLFADSNKILAILPTGTGNDLANTFQLHLDLTKACKTLSTGIPRSIDVGCVYGKDFSNKPVERYFGGVASFGFDADVPYLTNSSSKRLPGTWNYILAVFKTLIRFKPKRFLISYENDGRKEVFEDDLYLCAIGNGKFYGGGMMIVPPASVTDGKFHFTVVKKASRLEFIKVFPRVYKGEHVTHPVVKIFEASNVEIANKVKTLWQTDGEVIGYTPVRVKTFPKKLKVLSPKVLPNFHINT